MENEQIKSGDVTLKDRSLAIFFGVGGVALVALIGLVLVRLSAVALLLLISLMLAAALDPIVRSIRKRFSRRAATIVVVVTLLLGTIVLLVVTLPIVFAQTSILAGDLDKVLRKLRTYIGTASPGMATLFDQLKVATLPSKHEPQAVKEVAFSAFTFITSFVTVLMLTAYLVVDGHNVGNALVGVLPRKNRLQVRRMFGEIGDQAGAYIRGQIVTSFLAGVVTYGTLTAFSVPNALALGWIMAVLDAIPIVGPILGIVPAVASASSVSEERAVYVLIALTLYHQVESFWLVPRIYGRALNLSPLTVLFSILVGASLFGMVGAFLALPIAAVLPTLVRNFNEWRNLEPVTPNLPGEVGVDNP